MDLPLGFRVPMWYLYIACVMYPVFILWPVLFWPVWREFRVFMFGKEQSLWRYVFRSILGDVITALFWPLGILSEFSMFGVALAFWMKQRKAKKEFPYGRHDEPDESSTVGPDGTQPTH